ncbi:alpha/beta fold hydrolase [Paractinoplanes brasiliensis]|uniref:Pimeloyl-ACP methyl ester carboxylesterase n=1 Tax=Paractinoplanes brasiliensis TaxID=52695 RepID=A0A4R6J9N4_9ACTN|nr:alpha/beta hydrolase [Actinoplanes brasiliensis]TDO32350.1 pimeloyl-ACP methyl ester carboxylesterase [Actinoplanes brasiliensis]GID27783.1 alpha/beta hydrolase [Actinoplanes brasiliensis]
MPVVRANGIDVHYETVGNPDDPAFLLIMGLGAQLIAWPADFCAELAARGFHVVLLDNRDVGLSTAFDELGPPDVAAIMGGDPSTAPYLISDMAADAAGLLKALDLPRAHVAGVSMGGMIAQQLTIDHPDLVASLCSIMSTTGDRTVGRPTPEAMAVLMRPPGTTRDEILAGSVATSRAIGSPAYPAPDERLHQQAVASYERSYRPQGTQRQYAAILASPDRTTALATVTTPTLIIHGEADPLINVSGGRATAAAIPGAELLVLPGMGHDLPQPLWPQIIDAMTANTARS